MGALVGWFVARGLGGRAARGLAHVVTFGAIFALLAAVVGLWLHFHDKAVVAEEAARIDAKGSEGREISAEEAAVDAAAAAQRKEQTDEAIDAAHDTGPPSPSAVALACDQLRRARIATPAECGPGGGDGKQAGPDR